MSRCVERGSSSTHTIVFFLVKQEIYKDPDYRSLGQSAVRTSVACIESVAFLLAQLTLEGQRSAESDVRLKEEMAKQRHENGRLTMQVFLQRYCSGKTKEYSIDIQSRSHFSTGAINPVFERYRHPRWN